MPTFPYDTFPIRHPLSAEPHLIAAPVVVCHPVHILGGGAEAGDCVLAGAKGIEALIDFRWGKGCLGVG